MKYCVPYYRGFRYMDQVDEVIIPYDEKDVNFIQSVLKKEQLKNKILIMDIENAEAFQKNNTIQVFAELQQKDYNLKLRFDNYNEDMKDVYQELKQMNIPFFFALYVRHWDVFTHLINLGVSDIYVIEELAFELNLLGPVAHAKDISIRVFANVAQSSCDENYSVKSFFIRPEDVIVYAPYVDVIEFLGEGKEIQETLYKIYAIKGKWIGDLNELIMGLMDSIPNKSIIPAIFGEVRAKCGKKCLKGGKCNICTSVVNTAKALDEKDLIFK